MGEPRKVIISLAPVAGRAPLDPRTTARDVINSIDAGAGMCHLHCKTREGALTTDISVLSETYDRILAERDVVVQVSTGGISTMNIQERCRPVFYPRAESASLNGGSTNLGEHVYANSFADIRYVAEMCHERNLLPEIEVFEIGMINNILLTRDSHLFKAPLQFNLVFGNPGSMPATVEALAAFRSFVPSGSQWGVTHLGRNNWTFLAAAIAMGASLVRIGFEDSAYLDEAVTATDNCQLVEKLVSLIRSMGLEPATPQEARNILKLQGE